MKSDLKAKLSTYAGLAIIEDARLMLLRDCGRWPASRFEGWRQRPDEVPGAEAWALHWLAKGMGFDEAVTVLNTFEPEPFDYVPAEIHIQPRLLLKFLEAFVESGAKP